MNFLIFISIGFGLANLVDLDSFIYTSWFNSLSTFALLIGLYGSVYGIDKDKLFNDKRIVVLAVTIGVVLKIFIIGLALFIVTKQLTLSFLIATIIAQIDPLSVVALEKNRLSERGNTILRAWASFDDPMTVIISVWISVLIVGGEFKLFSLGLDITLNLLFAFIIYLIYKKIKYKNSYQLILLISAFIVAIPFEFFLGMAIVAICLRPRIDKEIDIAVKIALAYVSIVMGILISLGVNIMDGVLLGIFTIIAQFVTSWLLTKNLEIKDRMRLSIAQQSGITAITLSVYFSHLDSKIVATVAVAILTINLLYFILNRLYEVYEKTI